MPKSIKEITQFTEGILLNASEKDIPIEAPVFSLNINPMAQGGILDSIYNNKLVATSNKSGVVEFDNPATWNESGITTTSNYNNSSVIISSLKSINNESRCTMKFTGVQGREEQLQLYDIEPWWEILTQKTDSDVNTYIPFKTNGSVSAEQSVVNVSNFGKASISLA